MSDHPAAILAATERWFESLAPRTLHGAVWMGLVLIGWFDYVTGIEIRVFPLYFLPLMLSAWCLGASWAMLHALACMLAWLLAQVLAGREYSAGYIWLVNALTQGAAFVLIASLVSGLRKVVAREHRAASTDALTGLANSRSFYRKAKAILADGGPDRHWPVLVFVDLDHFKQVNDRLGHEGGDVVLVAAARLLEAATEPRELAARLGGDEFALLLLVGDRRHAEQRLETLVDSFRATPALAQSGVTASIGAVMATAPPAALDELVSAADAVMYEVKAAGRDGARIADSCRTAR